MGARQRKTQLCPWTKVEQVEAWNAHRIAHIGHHWFGQVAAKDLLAEHRAADPEGQGDDERVGAAHRHLPLPMSGWYSAKTALMACLTAGTR